MATCDKTWLGLPAASTFDDPKVGSVLAGRYRLLRELGAGQMARVYVAEQIEMGRNVALKLLLEHVELDDIAIQRFRREMKIAATLSCPHTITYFDAGESEAGTPFLAMELLAGETLRQRLERDGTLPAHEVSLIAAQLAESLQEAHDIGVVHRDLKPENIFLCRRPASRPTFAKVLDFGLAKLLHPSPGSPCLTDRCTTVGTPAYMAPEQFVAERTVDHRADLYALGVICFEMLTGHRPFEGTSVMDVAIGHITRPIPSALDRLRIPFESAARPGGAGTCDRNAALPASVDAFFRTALAKRGDDRFDQATDVADALDAVLCNVSD